MKTIIIGGGKLVYFLSKTFISKGYDVTIINNDKQDCEWFAKRLGTTVIKGDGSDLKIQQEAKAGEADCLIAITPNDEDNLISCQVAGRVFGVPRIISFVNNPENATLFERLRIDIAISPVEIISKLIEQKTEFEEITNLIPLAEGKINVTEIVLTEESPVLGKSIEELDFPREAIIACIIRGGSAIVPNGFTILEEEDKLILISIPEEYHKAIKLLTGEK